MPMTMMLRKVVAGAVICACFPPARLVSFMGSTNLLVVRHNRDDIRAMLCGFCATGLEKTEKKEVVLQLEPGAALGDLPIFATV